MVNMPRSDDGMVLLPIYTEDDCPNCDTIRDVYRKAYGEMLLTPPTDVGCTFHQIRKANRVDLIRLREELRR